MRRGSHASEAPNGGARSGAVGDGCGAMQSRRRCNAMHCCGGSRAQRNLAAEPVKDANFSCEFGTSASAREILPTNLNELERLRGVLRCAVDGKAPKSTPSWSYLASVRCGGYSQHPAG